MKEAVSDLGFDLETKLDWMRAEVTSIRAEISYSDIKKMITSAPQPARDKLKTSAWRDFFVAVCTNETMAKAVKDLRFDVVTKLDWMFEEGTNWRLLEPIINSISPTDVDRILKGLNKLGRLDSLLAKWPKSKYIKLDKFYYNTKDQTLKKKIEK
jgi:hypothetical protein